MFKSEDFIFDVTIEGHQNRDPEPRHYAAMANEKIQPLLAELQRLQELCQTQEQHGMEFALEIIKENKQLSEDLKKAEKLIKFIRSANPYPDLSEHKYITAGKLIQEEIQEYFFKKEND